MLDMYSPKNLTNTERAVNGLEALKLSGDGPLNYMALIVIGTTIPFASRQNEMLNIFAYTILMQPGTYMSHIRQEVLLSRISAQDNVWNGLLGEALFRNSQLQFHLVVPGPCWKGNTLKF